MKDYNETISSIFEKGDAILEKRRKRLAIVKRISFSMSGICAAVLIGVGIFHNDAVKGGMDNDWDREDIITETSAEEPSEAPTVPEETASPVTAVTKKKTTTASIETNVTYVNTTTVKISESVLSKPTEIAITTASETSAQTKKSGSSTAKAVTSTVRTQKVTETASKETYIKPSTTSKTSSETAKPKSTKTTSITLATTKPQTTKTTSITSGTTKYTTAKTTSAQITTSKKTNTTEKISTKTTQATRTTASETSKKTTVKTTVSSAETTKTVVETAIATEPPIDVTVSPTTGTEPPTSVNVTETSTVGTSVSQPTVTNCIAWNFHVVHIDGNDEIPEKNSYNYNSDSAAEEDVGSFLMSMTAECKTSVDGVPTVITQDVDIYRINGISAKVAAAFKFDCDDRYFIYTNIYYAPDDLGSFISETGLTADMFGAEASYDEKKFPATPIRSFPIDEETIAAFLEKNSHAEMDTSSYPSFHSKYIRINIDHTKLKINGTLTVYSDGLVWINLRKSYYIHIESEDAIEFINSIIS